MVDFISPLETYYSLRVRDLIFLSMLVHVSQLAKSIQFESHLGGFCLGDSRQGNELQVFH